MDGRRGCYSIFFSLSFTCSLCFDIFLFFFFFEREEKKERKYTKEWSMLQSININFPGFFFLNRSYFPSRHALKTFSWLKKLVARARGGGGGGGDK